MSENDALVKRIAALEGELDELKQQLPKAEKPFKPEKPWQKFDPTEQLRMPASAVKPMADLINPKGMKYDPNAWARNRYPQPGGFGPPKWGEEKKPQVTKAEQPKPKDTRSPQTQMFDAMVDYLAGGPNDTRKLR